MVCLSEMLLFFVTKKIIPVKSALEINLSVAERDHVIHTMMRFNRMGSWNGT